MVFCRHESTWGINSLMVDNNQLNIYSKSAHYVDAFIQEIEKQFGCIESDVKSAIKWCTGSPFSW